jgi:hypothetical protein
MGLLPRICVVLPSEDRRLCDGLITRPQQSYQVSTYIKNPPVWGGQGPYKDCRATDEIMNIILLSYVIFIIVI